MHLAGYENLTSKQQSTKDDLDDSAPAKSTRLRQEVRVLVTPPCVQVRSSRQLNTQWERLESAFTLVAATCRLCAPLVNSCKASLAAQEHKLKLNGNQRVSMAEQDGLLQGACVKQICAGLCIGLGGGHVLAVSSYAQQMQPLACCKVTLTRSDRKQRSGPPDVTPAA